MGKYKILDIKGKTDDNLGEVLFVEITPLKEENKMEFFNQSESLTLVYPSTEETLVKLMELVNSYLVINLEEFKKVKKKELPSNEIVIVYQHPSCYTIVKDIKNYLVINFEKSKNPNQTRDILELQITELKKDSENRFYTQKFNTMSVAIPFNSDEFLSILKNNPQKVLVGLDLSDFKKVSNAFQLYELYVHQSLFIQSTSEYIKAIRNFNILYTVLN